VYVPFRKLRPLLFIAVYLLSFSRNYFPYIDYTVNFDFISTSLCINKEVNSFCQGSCYLNKELKKAAETERSNPGSLQVFAQAEILTDAGEIQFTIPFAYRNTLIYPPVNNCWAQVITKYQAPPPKS